MSTWKQRAFDKRIKRHDLGFDAGRYDENATHLVHEADKLWHTHLAGLQYVSLLLAILHQNSQIFSTVLMLAAP